MSPTIPELGALRPARGSDIPRLGIVATAGFWYSPVFQWERPHHAQYPEDTLSSYQKLIAAYLQDPKYITLVAEDEFNPDEAEKTSAVIAPYDEAKAPKAGEKVIVGVACWRLEQGSKRVGQFGNITGKLSISSSHRSQPFLEIQIDIPPFYFLLGVKLDCPPEQEQLYRDTNAEHCRLFDETATAAVER